MLEHSSRRMVFLCLVHTATARKKTPLGVFCPLTPQVPLTVRKHCPLLERPPRLISVTLGSSCLDDVVLNCTSDNVRMLSIEFTTSQLSYRCYTGHFPLPCTVLYICGNVGRKAS